MASVDLRTGKIVGCKKGTVTWWHEKAHLAFNSSNFGHTMNFYGASFLTVTIFFLVLTVWFSNIYIKLLPVSSIVLYLFTSFYEEIWCWKYALKKIKAKKLKFNP